MFITNLTPECSVIYYLESTSWDYTNETWCPVINDIDFYYSVGMCTISAALYFLIFGKLLLMVKFKQTAKKLKFREKSTARRTQNLKEKLNYFFK
jgi:hypothetical protein